MIPRRPKDMHSDVQQSPLGVSKDVKESQWKVLQEAARVANARIREEFLTDQARDTYLLDKVRKMRKQNAAYLRASWSPMKPDPDYGLSLTIRDSDSWLINDPHYFRIEQIVVEAVEQAIMAHSQLFFSALLRDALKSPHPYYRISDKNAPSEGRLKTFLKGLFGR